MIFFEYALKTLKKISFFFEKKNASFFILNQPFFLRAETWDKKQHKLHIEREILDDVYRIKLMWYGADSNICESYPICMLKSHIEIIRINVRQSILW